MSEVKVNKVSPRSGTGLQLGDSGDTITIPSGATLANSGTATGFASIAWQSSIVTGATHTAAAGQGLWLDTSSNAITLTLPASPSVGDQVIFTDYARNWGTNAVTLNLNSEKYQGNATPVPVYDTNGESVNIVYSGSTKGWIPNTDGAVALETPQNTTCDFLVIAGGGSGGALGGGGGAGGYRNSFASESSGGGGSSETALSLTPGTTYTITVGDGGAGGATSGANGTAGVDSSISGTGITTITSTGGGRGAGYSIGSTASAGGSGGGGNGNDADKVGGSGTANQGFDGGDGNTSYTDVGGGGGGASAQGVDVSSNAGTNGGNGLSSSITGSAVTRAGGGGGGANNDTGLSAGSAGSGGAGAGGSTGNGSAATANTGSGGGGGGYSGGAWKQGGAGGSGVVILSMADADYSSTTTGSPTVATGVSGKTVLTFTGSGSYTA